MNRGSKRDRSQSLDDKDQVDQDRINRHKAYTSIATISGTVQQRMVRERTSESKVTNQKFVQTRFTDQEEESTSLGAFASTRNMSEERWYFDSGCSQHMIGNRNILTKLQFSCQDNVIFRDSARGRITGTCTLIFHGLSKLKEVFLVEGLMVNLIIISRLCDENLFVRFTKEKCIVFDQNHYQIMEGKRSSNNCYM